MEAWHGGTDLSRRGRARHRAGDGARPRRGVPRRGRRPRPAACSRRRSGCYEQFGPLRVRDTPISEQAILGAAMGAAMTGLKPIAEIMFSDFFAVCFDYIANEFPEEPLHVERPAQVPAGGAHRQRRGLALRRAALAERRELGDDDPRPQGGGAVDAARRDRPAGGRGARSRSGDLLRAQVALCRPRARCRTARSSTRSAPPRSCGPARTRPSWRWR